MMGYGYGNMAWMWPWMLVGSLLMIAALAALVLLVVKISRGTGLGTRTAEGHHTARQILDERYARGEIDETDYKSRRENLDRE